MEGGFGGSQLVTDRDGAFRLQRIPPGTYHVNVAPKGKPSQLFHRKEVGPRAILDLGDARFAEPGVLVVRLRCEDGSPVQSPLLVLDGVAMLAEERGVSWRSTPLRPGRRTLAVCGDNVVPQEFTFDIRAGEQRREYVTLRQGTPREFVFHVPRVPEAPGMFVSHVVFSVVFADASGRPVWKESFGQQVAGLLRGQEPARVSRVRAFAPGAYRVEASDRAGNRGTAAFTVGSGESSPVEVRLEKE
jgi:hypothetical protein